MKDNLACVFKRGKDKTKLLDNVNLVYQIKCDDCPSTYVGKTKRALFHRKEEHEKDIFYKRDKPVSNYCTDNNHTINCDGITILDLESNYYRRNISEKLNIKKQLIRKQIR